jgi:hypothetical protein
MQLRDAVVLAQSLVEYGALSSAIAKGQEFLYAAESWVAGVEPESWLGIGLVLIIVLLIMRRRRRSLS